MPLILISLVCSILVLAVDRNDIFPILTTFVIAIQRLNVRLIGISNSLTIIVDNSPGISRLEEIISDEHKEFRRSGNLISNEKLNKINFSKVGFNYNYSDNFSLKM